jgi:NADH-quinone oxidoreductase subunit J
MNAMTLLWWALALVAVAGALVVVLAREVTRLLLGLGAFLLALAGFHAWYGFGLLAVAEIFVYGGGVLVLFVFAIAALGRDAEAGAVRRSFDIGALAISAGVGLALWAGTSVVTGSGGAAVSSVEAAGTALLGPLLPQFEAVGVLLLVALVAALAIVQGSDDR